MVLENPCHCGCLRGRKRRNANIRSLNNIKHPISGFQSRKRKFNFKRQPLNHSYRLRGCRERCNTNRLNDYATRNMVFDKVFNSFSMPNGSCVCRRKKIDPNLAYRQRPRPSSRKNKCCNICLPDAVVNNQCRMNVH